MCRELSIYYLIFIVPSNIDPWYRFLWMNLNDIKSEKSFADDLQQTSMPDAVCDEFFIIRASRFLGRQGLMIHCVTADDDKE